MEEEAKPEQISNWILEFLIRNPNLESLAKKSLAVLPLPGDDLRLKKIVLLRTIECEITDGTVAESTLEALELIEEIDSRRGLHVADAMKAAYAAVAVDLTVRFLVGNGGRPEVKYLGALQRVWRARVGALDRSEERRSGLFTGELRRRWDEVEAAIWDESVCERLMGLNTRNEAVLAVRAYLKEAWVLVGKMFVGYGVTLRNVDEDEEDECLDKGISLIGLAELAKKVGFGCDSKDVALRGSVDLVTDDTSVSNCKEIPREKAVVQRSKHVAAIPKRNRGPIRISDVENSDAPIVNMKYNSIPTPEVSKVQEALKSSMLELKNSVKDPLPEAVQAAETVISELTTKNATHECSLENQSVRETDAANVSVDKSSDPVLHSEANLGEPSCSKQNDVPQPVTSDLNLRKPSCSQQNGVPQPVAGGANLGKPSSSNQNGVPRPSLMERNSTAHTLEWDDSLDETPEAMANGKSRLHLPSPKKRLVSPLKKYQPTKLSKRRKVKRWSLLEEDTLRTGVQKFGRGNWKLILNSNRDIFEERTEVDLKDKWRNLMR